MKKANLNTTKIKLINDIIYSNDILTTKTKKNKVGKKIGIIYICDEEKTYFKILDITRSLVNYLLENGYNDYEINLIPFYNYKNNDTFILNKIKSEISSEIINVCNYTNDFDEILDLINNQDYLITMRYHALLISAILQKNILSIIYDEHQHYENKISYIYDQQNLMKNQIYFSSYSDDELKRAFGILFSNNNNNVINYEILLESQRQIEQILKEI